MPYRAEAQPQALPRAFSFAKLANSNALHDDGTVEMGLGGSRQLKPGDVFLGHLRYLSFNAEKIQAHLQESKDWSILSGVVEDREGGLFGDSWKDSTEGTDECRIFNNLSPSKRELFQAVLQNSVQLVWGPPGSGKTHFLAASIELMIRLSRRIGMPCRILCTAFTKAATLQLLYKLVGWSDSILWLGEKEDNTPKSIKCLESASQKAAKLALLETYLNKDVCIVGGTVWKLQKWIGTSPDAAKFDLVVIDEASQLAILPATIAASMVAPETGRIVIVGDHRQIAPIRKGKYPPGQLFHSSIIHWLAPKDEANGDRFAERRGFGMLKENHRMNSELCSLTHSVYSSAHNPVPDVGAKRLSFNIDGPAGSILNFPESSIMIILRFDQHSAFLPSPTGPEALLVTRLARAILDSPEFAPKDLIVCVPHRQQRSAINAAMVPPDAACRIDTVNRIQGQEAEATIVSYGLLTPAMIDRETAFIYSISMLIVASTRAKRKNVIIVPEYLLGHSFSVLNDPKLFECLTYLHNLHNHSRIIEIDVDSHPLCQM
jgi:DNA replication ATP-dependent helicase Dna2